MVELQIQAQYPQAHIDEIQDYNLVYSHLVYPGDQHAFDQALVFPNPHI